MLPPPPGRTGTAHDHPSADPCPALEGRLPGLVPAEEEALVLAAVGAKHKHDTNRYCAANMLFTDNMQRVNTLCADSMQTNMQTICRLFLISADYMQTRCTHYAHIVWLTNLVAVSTGVACGIMILHIRVLGGFASIPVAHHTVYKGLSVTWTVPIRGPGHGP